MGVRHFGSTFRVQQECSLPEIIQTASLFPCYVDEDENNELMTPITSSELEAVLHQFKKDKSPQPHGWTLEFYDLIGINILRIVEECRTSGKMYDSFNSTFIALIPKQDNPQTFDEFRPISLCNYIYKIIAKIIANRLRHSLSKHISKEQIAFLENRHIH